MSHPTIFMFSGQGSQYYQMGRALYEQGGTFALSMDRMDDLVRSLTGRSVLKVLFGARTKATPFDEILYTHPAIYMVEVALADHLMDRGIVPQMTLGASLGSYAAATVSGCIEMQDALALVLHNARCVSEHCSPGGMLAVLGDASTASWASDLDVTLAGRNFDGHYVLSGSEVALNRAELLLRATNTTFQRLPVRYAFHSQDIDVAKSHFLDAARHIRLMPARIPMICCATQQVLQNLPIDYFWTVARAPIEFRQTIDRIEARGAFRYVDVGPSATLATFVKYALPAASLSKGLAVLNPYGSEVKNLEALVRAGA